MEPENAGSLGSTPQGESGVLERSGTKAQRAWADGAEMALQFLCDQGQVRGGHFGRGSEVSWVGKPPQGDNSSSLQTRVWAKTQGRICGSSTPSKALLFSEFPEYTLHPWVQGGRNFWFDWMCLLRKRTGSKYVSLLLNRKTKTRVTSVEL